MKFLTVSTMNYIIKVEKKSFPGQISMGIRVYKNRDSRTNKKVLSFDGGREFEV